MTFPTPTQSNFIIGSSIGVLLSFFGNHYITIHYGTFLLQLQPRVIFSGIGILGSILTIAIVFRIAKPKGYIRYGLAGFGIPLSVIDFVYLLNNVSQISHLSEKFS